VAVGREATQDQTRVGELLAVGVVELEAVAVALVDELLAIRLAGEGALGELAG
jgi:hypothetical protein